jgi:hypothetical protein
MSVWLDAVRLEFGVVGSKHPPREIVTSHFLPFICLSFLIPCVE